MLLCDLSKDTKHRVAAQHPPCVTNLLTLYSISFKISLINENSDKTCCRSLFNVFFRNLPLNHQVVSFENHGFNGLAFASRLKCCGMLQCPTTMVNHVNQLPFLVAPKNLVGHILSRHLKGFRNPRNLATRGQ